LQTFAQLEWYRQHEWTSPLASRQAYSTTGAKA